MPRHRFQIHLSTAVLLMFTAGGLIGANVRGQTCYYDDPLTPYRGYFAVYGWPFVAMESPARDFRDYRPRAKTMREYGTNYTLAAANIAVAVTTLLVLWFICEQWIRRRPSYNES